MICSMTGFGRSTFEVGGVGFEVEIRTVNHRHLDARAKLPRPLAAREADVKAQVQECLSRGKVDISVQIVGGASAGSVVELDLEAASQYIVAARKLGLDHDLDASIAMGDLLSLPGVARFSEAGLPPEELEPALDAGVVAALEAVQAMREREGQALADEFEGRLRRVESLVSSFHSRAGTVQEAVRERLRRRSEQLREETGILDEARLHQEIVLAADRLDITEELVRLRSHVDQFREILGEGGAGRPVGRKLDFLLQEMGRETNTVGSKANDAPLAHDVVELKTELERIREQVQNVE